MQKITNRLNVITEKPKEYMGKIHVFIISKPIMLLIMPVIYNKLASVSGKFHDFLIVGI
jgi:hypothetical protein